MRSVKVIVTFFDIFNALLTSLLQLADPEGEEFFWGVQNPELQGVLYLFQVNVVLPSQK